MYHHPADPSRAWDYPVTPGSPDLRMPMEEMAFQSLAEEASWRRPRPGSDVSPQGEDNLLSLPFPQKLWRLVNSSHFSSIWWDDGGTCLGINQKLFQKEILERDVPDKVFATDSPRSFLRQLNLYGFRKLRQRTFRTLTGIFPAQRPVSILNKVMNDKPLEGLSRRKCPSQIGKPLRCVHESPASFGDWDVFQKGLLSRQRSLAQGRRCLVVAVHPCDLQFPFLYLNFDSQLHFYCHPYFQRDSPHLLVRVKRRVGVKSPPRQGEEGQPGAAESRLAPAGTEQQDHRSPSEDEQVTPQHQDPAGPSSQIRSGSAPPATAVTAPHPAVAGDNAPVAQPAGEWSEGSGADVAPVAAVPGPAALPFPCFPGSPTQMNSDGPVVALPPAPPGTLALETTEHPAPGMPPFCRLWVPLPLVASVAAQCAAFMAMFPHPPALPHHCPDCHHMSQCMAASPVLQAYPDDADHHT
ncbi:Heat shock transcription factor, X-linked [Saguinus oedipus]|uniref:Heat shock transcription factor, X-linked n=1 Tax=Saguinus oedipus TaxID=9490 RepID=A0ABQ9TGM4_SAGOE|nr:Heat shock transcription factor, X-linked [Saguinus oedipus]